VERIGLVGLANCGKSSLFNALTGAAVPVASHPFTTTESATAVAQVPDARLARLAELHESKKIVWAGVEIVDIAGLVAGSGSGEGLGNRFLAGIREVDALCLVLRSFSDDEVPGESDPVAALGVLELELVLADLATVGSALTRLRKQTRVNASLKGSAGALEAAEAALEEGVPIYRSPLTADQRAELHDLFLLTNKPFFAVVNLGEDEVGDDTVVDRVRDELGKDAIAIGVSVKLESEAASLEPGDRQEMLEGFGLGEGALPRVARTLFDTIGRSVFFTTGDKESRAWIFRTGAKAPECAGVIHSDLARGFIRAEVIAWDALVDAGSWHAAKSAGLIRVEGKEYEVRDGDVLEIRFNV
jgi:GTP-binding protein YchF